jgi:sec-independent protein translocase protein TatA
MPGIQELLVILLIVIIIFGASKLPQLGKGLGEGIRNFKKGLKSSNDEHTAAEEGKDTGPGRNQPS